MHEAGRQIVEHGWIRRLVAAQADEAGVPHPALRCEFGKGHFADQLGLDPVRLALAPRQAALERRAVRLQRLQLREEAGESPLVVRLKAAGLLR